MGVGDRGERRKIGRPILLVAGTVGILCLAGCRSDVLPAVFGLGDGGISAYAPGTIEAVQAHEGDRLIGQSASETGRCIYENNVGRRFRADCPEGYRP